MEWRSVAYVRNRIQRLRTTLNQNNFYRTYYYRSFWAQHPEAPWALLAHMVSRNAGWQMSDLKRYKLWKDILSGAQLLGLSPVQVPSPLVTILSRMATAEFQAIFALLETGNFLIFHDVFPQLEVYRWAKQFPAHQAALFDLLQPNKPFAVDEFILTEWQRFFQAGQAQNWSPAWSQEWGAGSAIQRHSFALIVNEQNQIEDRLVNDPKNRYLKSFGTLIGPRRLLDLISDLKLRLTRLAFPTAPTADQSTPAEALLLYVVLNFTQLAHRIQTGRDLYTGLFVTQPDIRQRVVAWATAPQNRTIHNGTRQDYNPVNYDLDLLSLIPNGKKYSPPLREWNGAAPAWPFEPGKSLLFRHLHQPPIPLPKSVRARFSATEVETLISPLTAPQTALGRFDLATLEEVLV